MKLFDKLANLKSPKNVGTDDGHYEYKYYLVFSELEDEPTFELETKLTIGSQVGDIILEEETISPRHCTFTLNNDVISVLDHNSEEGTFIGKKEVEPGKMYILQDGDDVSIGDVVVEIYVEQIEVEPAVEEEVEQEVEQEVAEEQPVEKVENTATLELNTQILQQKIDESNEELDALDYSHVKIDIDDEKNIKKQRPTKPKGISYKSSEDPNEVSSSLTRLIALLLDSLITLIVYTILVPFDEFRLFLQDLPLKIKELVGPIYTSEIAPVVNLFLEENPAFIEMGKDIREFWQSDYNVFISALILFAIIRLTTTLLLGVSLGQAMIGIKASGNVILKRILGLIREFIGLLTGPFVIFDIATLFNLRSFKELITFTKITSPRLLKSSLLSFVSFIVLLLILLVSPMFQGLEFRQSFPMDESLIKKSKNLELDQSFDNSRFFGIRVKWPDDIKGLSTFSFKRDNKKLSLTPVIKIINTKTNKEVELKKDKIFNLKKLLKIAFNLNYFAKSSYPELFKYIHDASDVNANFKSHQFDELVFAKELQSLIRSSFRLDLLTIVDHTINHGPFVKGLVDFRDSLFQLIGQNVLSVKVDRLGDTYFVIFDVQDTRKSKLKIIPLVVNSNFVYEITAENKGFSFKNIQSMFVGSTWKSQNILKTSQANYLSFIDKMINTEKNVDTEYIQSFYELIYNDIKLAVENDSSFLISKWELVLNNYLKVLNDVKLNKEDKDLSWQKLYQNLNDLLRALRDKDSSFFGISKVERV